MGMRLVYKQQLCAVLGLGHAWGLLSAHLHQSCTRLLLQSTKMPFERCVFRCAGTEVHCFHAFLAEICQTHAYMHMHMQFGLKSETRILIFLSKLMVYGGH